MTQKKRKARNGLVGNGSWRDGVDRPGGLDQPDGIDRPDALIRSDAFDRSARSARSGRSLGPPRSIRSVRSVRPVRPARPVRTVAAGGPVTLCSASGDPEVPIANTLGCARQLAQRGVRVEVVDHGPDADHFGVVQHSVLDVARAFPSAG